MTTTLAKTFTEPTAKIALVTDSELQMLATIQGLFYSEDEAGCDRAWAALGRKEAAALMLVMMLTVLFDEQVVCKLRDDLIDCREAGCTNPTIIVCSEMEGGAS